VARPLVVGREARRVRRLGDLAAKDLLEGVLAAGRGTGASLGGDEHQMHVCGVWIETVTACGGLRGGRD